MCIRDSLYVVECALDPTRRQLYIIRDPASKVVDYRFDHNWQSAADEIWEPDEADR